MRTLRHWARFPVSFGLAAILFSAGAQAQLSPENAVSCVEGATIPIIYGEHTLDCQIGNESDLDEFSFLGTAGDQIQIVFEGFDAVLELRDPFDNPLPNGGDGVNDWILPETGAYQLRVFDSQSSYTGPYQFQLERTWPRLWGVGLSYDDVAWADRVDPDTDTDWIVFKGRSATEVRLVVASATGAAIDPAIEVLSPDGASLVGAGCEGGEPCSFFVDFYLTQDGTQHLQLYGGSRTEIGDYEISLQCLFGACPLGYYIRSVVFASPTELSWAPVSDPDATYDVVGGDLRILQESEGDFSIAVTDCVSTDNLLPFAELLVDPDLGEGLFYVVRALQDDVGVGSYDTGRASQISRFGGRDLGALSIDSSPDACNGASTGPVFVPDTPAGDLHMAAGAVDGSTFDVEIRVTDIDDFFGAAFHVSYDPASAAFLSFESTGSFLLGHGASTVFDAALIVPGELAVAASLLGQVAGVPNADGLLITLRFVATASTPSNPFSFAPEASREVTVCPTAIGPCSDIAAGLIWTGGTLTTP